MNIEITYVYHNCFVVKNQDHVLLFDYPNDKFLPVGAQDLVESALRGTECHIFVSHGHEDHFTPEISRVARVAQSVQYVLSYDIVEMFPEFDPEQGSEHVLMVEPDETYCLNDMEITCYESTDLGVGFLIRFGWGTLYFGGDVAEWVWQEQDARTREFSEKHFSHTLKLLEKESVDIAFSNADGRLANWAGGLRFIHEVRPRFFIPMHSFGNVDTVRRFSQAAASAEHTQILTYNASGDVLHVTL